MEINEINEQTQNYFNNVTLNGTLTEFSFNEGKGNSGRWISIKGAIQYGPNKSETQRFEAFASERTSKGEPSKLYDSLCSFKLTAKPVTKTGSVETASKLAVRAHISGNDYVNKSEKLVNSYRLNAYSINPIGTEQPCLKITVDGVVDKIYNEVRNGVETGKKMMRVMVFNKGNAEKLIAPVFFLDKVTIPEKIADNVDRFMSERDTVNMVISTHLVESNAFEGMLSFGEPEENSSAMYSQFILKAGGGSYNKASEEKKREYAASNSLIKAAKEERANILKEIEGNGYLGSASASGSSSGSSSTKTSTATKVADIIGDDDDMPF